jgi:osmotically-inducible protein OsmY
MRKAVLLWLGVAALAPLVSGCVPVAAVGVGAATVLSVEDRRTTGTQVEDEGIELRASNRISERFSDKVHINITSYNRNVLMTGEAPNEQTRAELEKLVTGVPSVRGVTNDVQVGGNTSLTSRANDAGITGKVKARFLDAGKFSPVHVKVVTENGVVYLLGLVTQAEADAAVEVARTTGGVRKVVKVFEYCKTSDAACAPRERAKAEEKKK